MSIELFGEPLRRRRLAAYLALLVCAAAAALIFLPVPLVGMAVLALAAIPMLIYVLDQPKLLLYLLLIILFSNVDVFLPFRFYRLMLAVFLAAFLIAIANGRRLEVPHPTVAILVAAFCIAAIGSIAAGQNAALAVKELGKFFKMVIIVILAAQFVGDRREFRRFVIVLAAAILMNSYLPLFIQPPERLLSRSVLAGANIFRFEGYTFEPNGFAMLQIFFIPLSVFITGFYRKPSFMRPLFATATLASIALLILTFSRGGFVALVALLLTLLVVERRNRIIFSLGIAAIVVGIVLAPGLYWSRIESILTIGSSTDQDLAIVSRLKTMEIALRLGIENPILGVGIGNFICRAPFYIPFGTVVHNAFIQTFVEIGLPGLCAMLALIAVNFSILVRLAGRAGDPEAARAGRALIVQQVAVCVNSLFIPVAYDMVLWFCLALPAMAHHAYRQEPVPAESAR